jgi:hypothetical protein
MYVTIQSDGFVCCCENFMLIIYFLRRILITGNNISSLNEKIQNVKDQLEKWFYENHLIINTDKSKVLFFFGEVDLHQLLDPFFV